MVSPSSASSAPTAEVLSLSDEDYYNDALGVQPTLSYSIASTLVRFSPRHAWLEHPRLGGKRWEPTPEMELGSVIDALLLDGGRGLVEVEFDNFRTNDAKAVRDAAREARKTPVLSKVLAEARHGVEIIRKQLEDFGLPLIGESQVKMAWTEDTPFGPVRCRGKIDHWIEPAGLILEVKTKSGSLHPRDCAKQIVTMGYDVQRAAYVSAAEHKHPDLAGRINFVWAFVETEPPYVVTPVEADGMMRSLGDRRWARACATWARCLKTGKWPGYVTEVARVDPPVWALAQEDEEGIY